MLSPFSFLAIPAAFRSTDINMSESAIDSDATLVRQQGFRIGCNGLRCNAGHNDVSRHSVQVLAGGATAHSLALVMGSGAEAAVDGNRLSEVRSDFLQDTHKFCGNENRIRAILTGELPHSEICG